MAKKKTEDTELIAEIKEIQESQEDEVVESPEESEDTIDGTEDSEEMIVQRPEMFSTEWTEYILNQLEVGIEITDDEHRIPTCDGLRRIFNKEMGRIIYSAPNVVKCPHGDDISCTVVHTIRYIDNETDAIFEVSDAFDVNKLNTKFPFYNASVATATTKAEARALRKGMGLVKVLSREEMIQSFDVEESTTLNDISDSEAASTNIKNSIKNLAAKGNIDITKLIQYLGFEDKNIETITTSEGQEVIRQLNEYSGGTIIPDDVKRTELLDEDSL